MQVLPTAPSPTVTHFMNLEALIFFLSFSALCLVSSVATRPYFQNNMLLPSGLKHTHTWRDAGTGREKEREGEKYGKLGLKSQLLPAMLLWDLNYQSRAPNSYLSYSSFLTHAPHQHQHQHPHQHQHQFQFLFLFLFLFLVKQKRNRSTFLVFFLKKKKLNY